MSKHLLEVRISIILRKDNLTFISPIADFHYKLKQYFNFDYSLDEIESALYSLEESYIEVEAQTEADNRLAYLTEAELNHDWRY